LTETSKPGFLAEIITLHPTHLTRSELFLKVGAGSEDAGIADALWSLRCTGLLRQNGKVVEPTLAALHAAQLSRWS
jgi:hypothetical protein